MAEQYSLPGLADPAPQADHLFYAILPSPAALASIIYLNDQLRAAHRLHTAPRPSINLHISLQGLGLLAALPPHKIEAAHNVAAAAAQRLSPFDVTLDRALTFAGNKALVLRAGNDLPGLNALHRDLGCAMIKGGIGRHVSPRFTPHVTLLYTAKTIAEHSVDPVRWPVHDFVLVHSVFGESRYVVLGRWPLRG